MTKRQLVKWLEAKQSDAKAEVEIQYATAEKAYFAQRDEALKINETVDEVFRLISEADTVANRWKEALEKVEGIDTTCGWYTSLTTKLSDLSDKENIRMYIMKDFTDGTHAEVLCKIPSTTLCETIYTVNKDRLGDFVRTCTDKEMEGVNAGILCSLGIAAPVVDGEPVDNSVTVERNLYKHLYEDLLNKVMAR